MTDEVNLKYFSLSSLVDTTFWHILSKKKLDELKLNDDPFGAVAFYRNDQADGLPPLVSFDYNSFKPASITDTQGNFRLYGDVIVTNTLEDFKGRDKQELITNFAKKSWDDMTNVEVDEVDDVLCRFLLFTYLDLKKFVFYYWFSFPSFTLPATVLQEQPVRKLCDGLSPAEMSSFEESWKSSDVSQRKYFLICFKETECTFMNVAEFDKARNSCTRILVAFADPSSSKEFPGWPLRGLITFLTVRFRISKLEVVSVRRKGMNINDSILWTLRIDGDLPINPSIPSVVGWEKNAKGKLLPRSVDLGNVLDPLKLAQNAVNLNLKLMRWRLVPELDLDKISQTKCLLLGSGTLGCNVARNLLAWGVHTITFVDNSKVSFSNPVRQSLFLFDQCLNGGLNKAQAAAESLKKIYPNVDSVGHILSIPMPGHFITAESQSKTKESIEKLEELVRIHDCIFLLMDTRESRWLPTLLGQIHGKLVINAALGFDTFLVQRHGLRCLEKEAEGKDGLSGGSLPGSRLGCYFCNDVVAPGDSTRDRTLDQQCTVTRPGVSMIAGALAVELMVSVIQHPQGSDAPAATSPSSSDSDDLESCLGLVPHQIRGFLSRFSEVLPSTSAFSCCTACSQLVVDSYRNEGFSFLMRAFNEPTFLEELTGLKKLHEETNLDDVWALSDDDLDSERSSLSRTSFT